MPDAKSPCPPLPVDEPLRALVDAYRSAKRKAADSARAKTAVEAQGHYDKDATTPRAVADDATVVEERRAALAVADALLAWVDHPR